MGVSRIVRWFCFAIPSVVFAGETEQRFAEILRRANAAIRENRAAVDLAERKAALMQLIPRNPRLAASLLLAPAEQLKYGKGSQGAAHLESPERYEGPITARVEDHIEGPPVTVYTFRDTAGRRVHAYASSDGQAGCVGRAELVGFRVDDLMLVTAARASVGGPVAAGQCSPLGTKKIAVIVMRSPGAPALDSIPDQAAAAFFGPSNTSAASFLETVSRGQTQLSGSRQDVYGPYDLSRRWTCSEVDSITAEAMAAVSAENSDLSKYTGFYILFSSPPDCFFSGASTLGCDVVRLPSGGSLSATISWQPVSTTPLESAYGVIAHELGHSLGLLHSRSVISSQVPEELNLFDVDFSEYGDLYSVMGSAGYFGRIPTPQMSYLGWLSRSEVQEVRSTGEFTIAPIDSPLLDNGLRALRIRRNPAGSVEQWLWLEYRPGGSWPGPFVPYRPQAGSGVQIRLEEGGSGRLLPFSAFGDISNASFPVGQTWRDPHSPLAISVVATSAESARVRVELEAPCAVLPRAMAQGYGSGPQTIEIPLSAPAECEWTAKSLSSWVQLSPSAGRGPGQVKVTMGANEGGSRRTAQLRIGHQLIEVTQRSTDFAPTILAMSPAASASIPSQFAVRAVVRDRNGPGDLSTVDFNLNVSNVVPGGCFVRLDLVGKRLLLRNDAGTGFLDAELPVGGTPSTDSLRNARCSVSRAVAFPFSFSEVNTHPEALFRDDLTVGFWVEMRLPTFQIFATATDSLGLRGQGQSDGELRLGSACWIAPSVSRLAVAAQAADRPLILAGNAGNCTWTATSNAPWVQSVPATGTGFINPANLRIAGNPSRAPREAVLRLGAGSVTIVQLGTDAPPRPPSALTPSGLLVPATGSEVNLTYSGGGYLLSEIPPVEELPAWARVDFLQRLTFRLSVAANSEATERSGWIRIGGAAMFVRQAANPWPQTELPTIEAWGIRNGLPARFPYKLVTDSITEIRGKNLASGTVAFTDDLYENDQLPEQLGGVRVSVNGKAAYPLFVSPDLIRVLIPASILPENIDFWSEAASFVFQVHRDGVPGLPYRFFHFDIDHGFRRFQPLMYADADLSGMPRPRARFEDGVRVGPVGAFGPEIASRPARPGDVVVLEASGLGPTDPLWVPGARVATPLALARPGFFVMVGGDGRSIVEGVHLVAPARFEVRFRVPSLASSGDVPIRIGYFFSPGQQTEFPLELSFAVEAR